MNSELSNFFQNAFKESLDAVGDNFTYKGVIYKGVISLIELNNDFKMEGIEEVLTARIITPKSNFSTPPKSGETLFVGTTKLRIMKCDTDEFTYELHLATATK